MKTVPSAAALAAVALAALIGPTAGGLAEPAKARAKEPCARGEDSAHCVVVLIDHLRRLSFRDEVRTVLVGNPAIADVTMISATEAVISAKSVGTTNMVFLNASGNAISDFEVLVKEPDSQRVVLRRGPSEVRFYQCAPRCERTLTQNDSPQPHSDLLGKIRNENALSAEAAGNSSSAAPSASSSKASSSATTDGSK